MLGKSGIANPKRESERVQERANKVKRARQGDPETRQRDIALDEEPCTNKECCSDVTTTNTR